MRRWRVLRPYLENDVALARVARQAQVPERTARRWLARYRQHGLAGLARPRRADAGVRRIHADLVAFIEGMALTKPVPAVATIHRRAIEVAARQGWAAPGYATVHAIVGELDPGLVTLARHGTKRYEQTFDLLHRRAAGGSNELWQADHTELDLWVLDPAGKPARPWLTLIEDDYSRAVAGYAVSLEDPTAAQTALVLRQAIWRKPEPGWHVCGIPNVFYTDHGPDFTSAHLEQVAVDLHMQLVFSLPGKPRGRGKIERLFNTINQMCLPALPGYAPAGTRDPASKAQLSLSELDTAIGRFLRETYHHRPHGETGQAPQARWEAGGFLPRLPTSLAQLDLLLLTVATPRTVHPDGVRFQGLRYTDPGLAAYVREPVTIRYDPRDLAEIRVYHHNQFICRAVCPELAGQTSGSKTSPPPATPAAAIYAAPSITAAASSTGC